MSNQHTKLKKFCRSKIFQVEKPALLPRLARLAESLGLTTFISPRNPESDIFIFDKTNPKTTKLSKHYYNL